MTDIFSTSERSRIMGLIRSKNTKVEKDFLKLVSSALYPKGIRYRKHYAKLLGRPDIVFVSRKVAIFIDGDFWHGYKFKTQKQRLPKKYWVKKIENNIMRDRKVNRELKKSGWRVLRFWEHSIKTNAGEIVRVIERNLDDRL